MSPRRKTVAISFLVLFLLFAAALFWGGGGFLSGRTEAGVQDNVHGWAWRSNIGWVSFNCTDTNSCGGVDYGVTIDEDTGILSGYAWSSNIGWVSFNESDLIGCPSGACKARLSGNDFIGWARALSGGTPEAGGWDGWISLRGPNYGVFLDGTAFKGFGWGSQVVGWVDFAPQFGGVFWSSQIPAVIGGVVTSPTVSLSADPVSILAGQTSDLSWSSTDADSCLGINFSTEGATAGLITITPLSTTDYTVVCLNEHGEAALAQVTVTVSGAEASPPEFEEF